MGIYIVVYGDIFRLARQNMRFSLNRDTLNMYVSRMGVL